MRQSIAAVLVAGVIAQNGGMVSVGASQNMQSLQSNPLLGGSQGFFPTQQGQQGQFPPQAQQQGQPQGQLPGQPQVQFQAPPQQAQVQFQPQQQAQVQFQAPPQQAQVYGQQQGPQVKGIPIGTVDGITDSDVACLQGNNAACGLPNIPNMWNLDPSMRWNSQQTDQLLWQLTQTGNYAANGQRVANQNNPVNLDIPYYQTGSLNGQNFGAVYSVNPNDPFRRPQDQLVNYVTNDWRAPDGSRPSASNAVLPSSAAFLQANLFPQTTTPVNTVTGAGFGYSKDLNAPGVSPVFTGGNWNFPGMGGVNFGSNAGGFLGRPTQNFNFGTTGFTGTGLNGMTGLTGFNGMTGFNGVPAFTGVTGTFNGLNGMTGTGFTGLNFGTGFNTGFNNGLNFQTVRPGGSFQQNFAPPTQNWLPTLPNGLTTAPAWNPSTGSGQFRPNVAPQQGQMPQRGGFFPMP